MVNAEVGRRPLVLGNWKLNGQRATNTRLLQDVLAGLSASVTDAVDIGVLPPHVYLQSVGDVLTGTAVTWGGQDLAAQAGGAFTGETAGVMLKDLGARWVLVGHSERRQFFGDVPAVVLQKVQRAFEAGLVPVVCIGETLAEREADQTEAVLTAQLDVVADVLRVADATQFVLAYEPVWAIGTGRTARPEQAQQVHGFVRQWLRGMGHAQADAVRLLYGGSVNAGNAAELFAQPDVDGGLVGGASLQVEGFLAICRAAA